METHLYLSLIPEALIYSQLPPDQFGKYVAIGDKKLSRGAAMFFEVDPSFDSDAFHLDAARRKCVAHPDGTPRRSSYAGVYMVLANVPVSALGSFYLVTGDGLVLELTQAEYQPSRRRGLHLYQEIIPVQPRVASPLEPMEFSAYVTNPANLVFLPRIVFCELRLNGLATDPKGSDASNLPYHNLKHLRECLTALAYKSDKMTKIVTRDMETHRLFPVMTNGFFVGDQEAFAYYPLPSEDEQETVHFRWFNSAMKTPRF